MISSHSHDYFIICFVLYFVFLYRSCSVNKMYLLVRPKKNTDPQDRLRKLFTVPVSGTVRLRSVTLSLTVSTDTQVFKKLWEERPKFIDDVLLITGDCSEPGLGISAAHEKFMVDNIDIVIHCAATINFNGPLKQTVLINVRATRDLMIMAQRMHRLKVNTVFGHVFLRHCHYIVINITHALTAGKVVR